VDQESGAHAGVLEIHDQVSGLLYYPVRDGVRGGAEHAHAYASAGVLDHRQDIDFGAVE
jgi:hypothetical protein